MTEAEKTAEDMIAEFDVYNEAGTIYVEEDEEVSDSINRHNLERTIQCAIKACDRIINVCQEVDNNAYDEEKLIERKIKHYEEVKQILESKL